MPNFLHLVRWAPNRQTRKSVRPSVNRALGATDVAVATAWLPEFDNLLRLRGDGYTPDGSRNQQSGRRGLNLQALGIDIGSCHSS